MSSCDSMSYFSIILLTISSSFILLLIDEQLRLPCRLLVLLLTVSSSCIMLLIIEQLGPPCRLVLLYCSSMSSSHIILLIIEQLQLPCRLILASLPLPLYCGILLLAKQYETIQGLSCSITADFDCGIMPTLLAALLPTRLVVS
jgi:hypothetical protein